MRILLLTDGINPFVKGGMQRHSQMIAENLAKQGNSVHVYHYSQTELEGNVEFDHFTDEAKPNLYFTHFVYKDYNELPGHYIRAQKAMSKQYLDLFVKRKMEVDFIYAKGFMGWEFIRKKEVFKIEAPIAVKFHGMNMFQKQADLKSCLQSRLLIHPVRTMIRKADYVFSYGGKITEIIKKECKTPILEVPTGIEEDWLEEKVKPVTDKLRFLFVGRYDRVKGLPELYSAIENCATGLLEWEFHFVGPIPDNHRIKSSRMIYHGAVYNEHKLKSIYSQCDVLVNGSISEGMPNVILEAMAQGLAIIATNVGATSVMVKDGINGILINKSEPRQIQIALESMLGSSKDQVFAMKNKSLELVKQLTWEAMGPKLEKSIRSCLRAL